MIPFLNKKEDEDEAAAKPAAPVIPHLPFDEFIPYYAHYNAHTLMTKNGELMQFIKIDSNTQGLNYESGDGSASSVRESIRAAIAAAITTDHYAVWIHTQRKRKPVSYDCHYSNPLAEHMQSQWQKKCRWKYQYYNEIYVTIMHSGQSCDLFDKKSLPHTIVPKKNRSWRNAYFDKIAAELDGVCDTMLQRIRKNYNAQRLAVTERIADSLGGAPVFYSEPVEFLGELVNMRSNAFPLDEMDISKQLLTHNLTFGFNALESAGAQDGKRFAALLTLKQYHEITPEIADHLLQYPVEMSIAQSIRFIPHQRALKQYREQKVLFEISDDAYSARVSGLDEMLRSNQKRPTDYCEQQTTIMVFVDEYRQLDREVHNVQQAFAQMGLIAVREDVKLEECFWSQLPGNFPFIRRRIPLNTARVGGFVRLNLFPDGAERNLHWKQPVNLIPTTVNSPYHFNFHHQDNGHTVLFDFNSFQDAAATVLVNFLLTSSLKFKGRTYIFDRGQSAQLFFNKLGGKYHGFRSKTVKSDVNTLHLNPFALEDMPRNHAFLLAWCGELLAPAHEVSDAQKAVLKQAIAQLYADAPAQRNLTALVEHIRQADASLAEAFSPFYGSGAHAGLFDAPGEALDLQTPLHAFDMETLAKTPAVMIAAFAYLMHRVINTLDGTPTIIVLHEAWDLLENNFFAPRLESLMEMLRQNNAMLIFTTRHPSDCAAKQTFPIIMQQCATQIYVPDDVEIKYHTILPALSTHDTRRLQRMNRQHGEFMIKQRSETIGLSVDFLGMEDVRSIFANDIKTLFAAGGPFASTAKAS